jgi:hypothetical protein
MTMATEAEYRDELYETIEILADRLWRERGLNRADVDRWLDNFGAEGHADKERLHALYLLSRSMFFPNREIRELTRALYRDSFKYPILREIRASNGYKLDAALLEKRFRERLETTRFLGIGNPSESGTHLLYFFRQENRLSKDLFIDSHEIFKSGTRRAKLRSSRVTDYVVLDDFCGTGETAIDFSDEVIADIRAVQGGQPKTHCYSLFATGDALDLIKQDGDYDYVESVFRLDETYRCFGPQSIYFPVPDAPIDKQFAQNMCRGAGQHLLSGYPLGYGGCELLVAFSHNTPDNSLPVLWYDEPPPAWTPMFPRYPKIL